MDENTESQRGDMSSCLSHEAGLCGALHWVHTPEQARASPGGLAGTQITRPHPRASESVLLGWAPVFAFPSDSQALWELALGSRLEKLCSEPPCCLTHPFLLGI